jgi:hypothetical protein
MSSRLDDRKFAMITVHNQRLVSLRRLRKSQNRNSREYWNDDPHSESSVFHTTTPASAFF